LVLYYITNFPTYYTLKLSGTNAGLVRMHIQTTNILVANPSLSHLCLTVTREPGVGIIRSCLSQDQGVGEWLTMMYKNTAIFIHYDEGIHVRMQRRQLQSEDAEKRL